MNILITCEHAGNSVPEKFKYVFKDAEKVLNSHRGWDPGAYEAATYLVNRFKAPLYHMQMTRLLIEMNRSIDNDQLFSEFSNPLNSNEKSLLIQEYYNPYRQNVEHAIEKLDKPVLHLSMHSFTPSLHGEIRNVDVGLLFDPNRKSETKFCNDIRTSLQHLLPELNIELNQPYQGTDDGFTTYLRTKFDDAEYLGIEFEVNQKFVNTEAFIRITEALGEAIERYKIAYS